MASFVFLLFLLFLQSAAASEVKSVKSGDDVILTCQADGGSITAVKWTRTDLKSEYVYVYTDGRSDPANQHPSFKGRVQLVDSDLKDGDVSLILKKVNMNDTGTYECRVAPQGSRIQKDPIRSSRLEVTDSGGEHKHTGSAPGDDAPKTDGGGVVGGVVVGVAVVVVVVVAVAVAIRRSKRLKEQRSNRPAVDESGNDDLL